eukprot:1190269-Prorocentrum_minimum.AAC.6
MFVIECTGGHDLAVGNVGDLRTAGVHAAGGIPRARVLGWGFAAGSACDWHHPGNISSICVLLNDLA